MAYSDEISGDTRVTCDVDKNTWTENHTTSDES